MAQFIKYISHKVSQQNEFFQKTSKSWDTEMMADWLKKEAHAFLGAVFVNSDMPDKVVSLDDEHTSGFACRWIGCNMTFPLHSARKR